MISFKITLAGPIILVEPQNAESGAFAVQHFQGHYDPIQACVWIKLAGELQAIKRLFNFHEVQFEVIEK